VEAIRKNGVDPVVIHAEDVWLPRYEDSSEIWKSLAAITVNVPNGPRGARTTGAWLSIRYQTQSWARWIHKVVSQAEAEHRRLPFDLVVSRALPRHAHAAGFWVSTTLQLPWIANMNDPWDLSEFCVDPSDSRAQRANVSWRLWWRRVCARADAVTFACDRLRDYCLRNVPQPRKVEVIPHIGYQVNPRNASSKFFLVHAGRMGGNDITGRNANGFLNALRQFLDEMPHARERTRLALVGPEDSQTMQVVGQLGLGDVVTANGRLSYEQSLQVIAEASACLLLEGPLREGVFLPSKLVDYIAARKPILAVSPRVGTVKDLSEHGGIRCISADQLHEMRDALVTLFSAFVTGRLEAEKPPEVLVQRFSENQVANAFIALAERVVNASGKKGTSKKKH
jgi:hypothetical protein